MKFSIKNFFGSLFRDARRIFIISKKPTRKEYMTMAKIVALGFIIIGVIGFIVYLVFAILNIGV